MIRFRTSVVTTDSDIRRSSQSSRGGVARISKHAGHSRESHFRAGHGSTPLYARVPVDLRSPNEAHRLGNLSTAIRVPLPVDTDSPADRLRTCQHLLSAVNRRCQAHRAALPVLEGISRAAPWLTTALTRHMIQPDVSTAVCTAFKWRGGPSHLHGRRLIGITALPPLPPPGTVNLDLVQNADVYTLTVVSHLRPDDSQLIADTVTGELTTLAAMSTSHVE